MSGGKRGRHRVIERLRREFPGVTWTYSDGSIRQWLGFDFQYEYEVHGESYIIDADAEVFGSQLRFNKFKRMNVESRVLPPVRIDGSGLFK